MSQTIDHLQDLILEIAKEQNFKHHDVDIKEISSEGANYTSTLYNITVSEGNNVLKMFAKVAVSGKGIRENCPRIFETESYAYDQLAKIYEQIQDDCKVPQEERLIFSKCYGYSPKILEEILVLEDLVASGYTPYNRFESFTWEYASTAIKELSKLHALSFAFEQYFPEEFKMVRDKWPYPWEMPDDVLVATIEVGLNKVLPNVDEHNRGKVKAFFDNIDFDYGNRVYKQYKRPVIGHGDFRPSNLMHKIHDDGRLEIKIVDLQTLQTTSPVTDLIYFMFTGSDEQFRAEHFDQLTQYYYTQLSEAMTRLRLNPENIYSRADFEIELKEKLAMGLFIALFTLPLITVEEAKAPKASDMNILMLNVDNSTSLFKTRLNGVINDFVKWGILQ